jgi:hypothetical protein
VQIRASLAGPVNLQEPRPFAQLHAVEIASEHHHGRQKGATTVRFVLRASDEGRQRLSAGRYLRRTPDRDPTNGYRACRDARPTADIEGIDTRRASRTRRLRPVHRRRKVTFKGAPVSGIRPRPRVTLNARIAFANRPVLSSSGRSRRDFVRVSIVTVPPDFGGRREMPVTDEVRRVRTSWPTTCGSSWRRAFWNGRS